MVDIAIVLRLDRSTSTSQRDVQPRLGDAQGPEADEDGRLAQAILAKTGTLDAIYTIDDNRGKGVGLRSINQTGYEPLRLSPIAVSIETKVSGD